MPCDDRSWGCSCEPRHAQGWRAASEARKRQGKILCTASRGSMALLTPWLFFFFTSSLQNQDNKFLLFKATQLVALCHGSPRRLMGHEAGIHLAQWGNAEARVARLGGRGVCSRRWDQLVQVRDVTPPDSPFSRFSDSCNCVLYSWMNGIISY